MSWVWRYEDGKGRAVAPDGVGDDDFPTQADAETWLGENWRELLAAGVEQVALTTEGATVYEMSLRPVE